MNQKSSKVIKHKTNYHIAKVFYHELFLMRQTNKDHQLTDIFIFLGGAGPPVR